MDSRMTPELDLPRVAQSLGYQFIDITLLRDALTHRSFANEHPERAPRDNERLEFLGDAVLAMVVSTMLWERFPEASEGELTRLRADLVCEARLAEAARECQLGAALRLGRGEERSGGRDKPRLLCCALEACLAAIYLDGGLESASRVIRSLFDSRLSAPSLGRRDHKTRVQELLQANGREAPRYVLLETDGPDHARSFSVACVSQEQELGRGVGRSKVEAEQAAACAALQTLGANDVK